MKALVLDALDSPLKLLERADLEAAEGRVVVDVKAAALNRRDYWITQGMYPGIQTPVILGSDGAGVVSQIGAGVNSRWLDQEIVINPGWNWGDDESVQSDAFGILGMPDDGTFASQVVVPAETLYAKPEHLNWHEAAALPLAAVTAYRAVFTKGNLQAGETILISGIGGGVATFALQFAVATGAAVFVTSSSAEKIDRAISLGAKAGFNYATENWHKTAKSEHGLMDLIIDSGGGDGYANLLDLAAAGGRIVNYGATAGPTKRVDLMKLFWKQLHLMGSTMGSTADFRTMLDFVNAHRIKPVVDAVYPFAEGNTALQSMKESRQFGKIVLDITL